MQAKPKESGTHKKTFKEQIACDEANKEYAVSFLFFFNINQIILELWFRI